MLSIGKLGTGNERYYVDTVAQGQGDYYSGRGEAPGKWVGKGAASLDLDGTVDPDDFAAVINGKGPKGDALRSRVGGTKVPGFDLTFSAPKSVSVLYGVGDDAVSGAARRAHDEAVRQALGYLEREACRVRRGARGKHLLRAEGLIVGTFRHRTSRAGDPQLHTHAVVANMAKLDGRWSALDSRSIFAHARTAGFLYQAVLRGELGRELGVQWNPVRNGMAEIAGMDPALLRRFSQRSMEIEEHLNQVGRRGARARELATLETRHRKDQPAPGDELRRTWRARAEEHGFGRDQLATLLNRPQPDHLDDQQRVAAADRLAGPGGVTRNASTFDRRDVLRDWAQEHRSGASVEQLERLADAWIASEVVVPLPMSGKPEPAGRRFTTTEMLAIEQGLVDGAQARVDTGVAQARIDEVERAISERPTLTDEQAALVRGLTQSGHGVEVVRAAAGTGKTFALDAARDAWQASDVPLLGCALSARAAVELQSQSGVRSDTVARLERQLAQGHRIPPGSVLIVDEAGMVGSRQLTDLARHAAAVDAKLVLVGDDHQLPEIDAGGAFRGLADRLGALELRTVIRQSQEWDRDALDHLRHGRVEEWAETYREHGRLVSHPTAERARRALVEDWWVAAREPGTEAAMIAHRRADVADLNRRARQLMGADGRLGTDELTLHDRAFAEGDAVLARRNDRRLEIVNGARGTVTAVDLERRSVSVELADGRGVRLDASYLDAGHLDHGYALTAHAAQGATVDKTFVLGSDDLYREWGYTALTRHRDEARYYAVSDASPTIPLPGLEPEPDTLVDDVKRDLGPTRRKQLALDSTGGKPIDVTERPPGTFAELRALEREQRRATEEAERLAARRADALLRRGELEAELEATPRLRVAARRDLREAIERQDRLLATWDERSVQSSVDLEDLDRRRALTREPIEPEPEKPGRRAPLPDRDPGLDLDRGM